MNESYPIIKRDEYDVDDSVKIDGPPGTGKSTQIVRRIEEYLKENEDSSIYNVVFVTYRKSLAQDVISRLKNKGIVPENFNSQNSYIGTLHAICDRLLKNNSDFDVSNKATSYARNVFCNYNGINYYGTSPSEETEGKELFSILDWLKSTNSNVKDIPQEKYDKLYSSGGQNLNVGQLKDKWVNFKKNPPEDEFNGLGDTDRLYDFDDMLIGVNKLNLVPEDTDLLVVDETHDVYPIMYDVLKMWIDELKEDTTIIVAGDPLQVINSYQGSSPKYYNSIDLPEIQLPESYRCPESHLDFAKTIISKEFTAPDIISNKEGDIYEYEAPTMRYVSYRDAWYVPEMKYNPEYLYNEFVGNDETALYLVRTKFQAKAIAQCLRDASIPYTSSCVDNWGDTGLLSLYNSLCELNYLPKDVELTFCDGLRIDMPDEPTINTNNLEVLIESVSARYLKDSKSDTLEVFSDMNGEYELYKLPNVFRESFFDDIQENVLDVFLNNVNTDGLIKLINKHEFKYISEKSFTAQIHTIHASKGMEADNVFLYDGLPTRIVESIERSDVESNNECRTWYVGSTRSSKNLVVLRNAFEGYYSSPYLPSVSKIDYKKSDRGKTNKVINNEN